MDRQGNHVDGNHGILPVIVEKIEASNKRRDEGLRAKISPVVSKKGKIKKKRKRHARAVCFAVK